MPTTLSRWQRILLLVLLVGLVATVVLGWHRFLSDFWPIDKSTVGPNLLASAVQFVIMLIVVAFIWPPTRHAFERWIHKHLTAHFAALHEKLDHHAAFHGIPPQPDGKGQPPAAP